MGRRNAASDPPPTTPDPVEIAMHAEADDDAADSPARRLLKNHNRLVRTQIASERVGLVLKLLTGAAGVIVAVALAAVVWDATNSRTLVVEPFSVPSDMAERGMTGPVAATRLLDELTRLQNRTLSYRAQESYANWKNDLKVEIPQTGVSIGELQAFLRQWLGEETRISGEVVRTPDGQMAVTVRAGAVPGRTFTGPEARLDALIARAAESVYGATQPERYAAYLAGRRDVKTADLILTQLTLSGSRRQRAWAYAGLSEHAATADAALENARMAVELDPGLPMAWTAMADANGRMGWEEQQLDASRRAAELMRGRGGREMAPWAAIFHGKQREAQVALLLGDLQGSISLRDQAATPSPDQPAVACRNCGGTALTLAAVTAAANHDMPLAGRFAKRAHAALGEYYGGFIEVLVRLASAEANKDWAGFLQVADAPNVRPFMGQVLGQDYLRVTLDPARATAMAGLGRFDEARAIVATTPTDCHPCMIARGRIEAMAGRAEISDRLFAAAAGLAPSLPAAHQAWAEAKLTRGDLDGAVEAAREARRRGPRWAEPWKTEGDALARKGDHAGAVRAYEQAAERAPACPELHQAWAASLDRLGRKDEAAEKRKLAEG